MEHEFWHQRWHNDEIGFHQELINPWLAYYYGHQGPAPETRANYRVFVPLCGKSRDMLWLAQNGFAVTGVEISAIAVRDFFEESRLTPAIEELGEHTQYTSNNISILQGDFFSCERAQLGPVTDVFDRASLIALPAPMRREYAAKMASLLEPGNRILLVILTYPEGEMQGPPFSVTEAEVEELFADHFGIEKLAVKNTLDDEPGFRAKGLTALTETAFKLTRRQA